MLVFFNTSDKGGGFLTYACTMVPLRVRTLDHFRLMGYDSVDTKSLLIKLKRFHRVS